MCIRDSSGAIRGAGESFQPMLITCFGVCGLRILWLALVGLVPAMHSMQMVAMNYPITWVIAAVVFIIYYLRMNWLRRCIRPVSYTHLRSTSRPPAFCSRIPAMLETELITDRQVVVSRGSIRFRVTFRLIMLNRVEATAFSSTMTGITAPAQGNSP